MNVFTISCSSEPPTCKIGNFGSELCSRYALVRALTSVLLPQQDPDDFDFESEDEEDEVEIGDDVQVRGGKPPNPRGGLGSRAGSAANVEAKARRGPWGSGAPTLAPFLPTVAFPHMAPEPTVPLPSPPLLPPFSSPSG